MYDHEEPSLIDLDGKWNCQYIFSSASLGEVQSNRTVGSDYHED